MFSSEGLLEKGFDIVLAWGAMTKNATDVEREEVIVLTTCITGF
jgi:hypothetical protein